VIVARFVRFNVVSGLGIGVQLLTLWLLSRAAHVEAVVAAAVAVAVAVVHNFLWHRYWTWADRRATPGRRSFMQFVAANGAVSLTGNVMAAAWLVEYAGMAPVLASLVAIVVTGLANFWLGDRVVFRR
jgi:putative flippase GtrA